MLKLTQSIGDSIYVFDGNGKRILRIIYTKNVGNQISLGFEATKDITILREKVLLDRDRDGLGNIGKRKEPNRIGSINGNLKNTNETIFFTDEVGE